jgi:hypothetical protein
MLTGRATTSVFDGEKILVRNATPCDYAILRLKRSARPCDYAILRLKRSARPCDYAISCCALNVVQGHVTRPFCVAPERVHKSHDHSILVAILYYRAIRATPKQCVCAVSPPPSTVAT